MLFFTKFTIAQIRQGVVTGFHFIESIFKSVHVSAENMRELTKTTLSEDA